MRVTEKMRLATTSAAQSRVGARLDKASRIATRGSRVESPSDDPVAYAAKVRSDNALSLIESRSELATKVSGELNVAEGALSTGVDLLSQVREAAVGGANESLDPASRKLLAQQVQRDPRRDDRHREHALRQQVPLRRYQDRYRAVQQHHGRIHRQRHHDARSADGWCLAALERERRSRVHRRGRPRRAGPTSRASPMRSRTRHPQHPWRDRQHRLGAGPSSCARRPRRVLASQRFSSAIDVHGRHQDGGLRGARPRRSTATPSTSSPSSLSRRRRTSAASKSRASSSRFLLSPDSDAQEFRGCAVPKHDGICKGAVGAKKKQQSEICPPSPRRWAGVKPFPAVVQLVRKLAADPKCAASDVAPPRRR